MSVGDDARSRDEPEGRKTATSRPSVTLYTRKECHLCDVAKGVLAQVRAEREFDLTTLDIDADPELRALYDHEVPVIAINGRKAFKYRVDPAALRDRLDRAAAE
jgi:glutaredoxin